MDTLMEDHPNQGPLQTVNVPETFPFIFPQVNKWTPDQAEDHTSFNLSWTTPACASAHCWTTPTSQNTLRKWVVLLNVPQLLYLSTGLFQNSVCTQTI